SPAAPPFGQPPSADPTQTIPRQSAAPAPGDPTSADPTQAIRRPADTDADRTQHINPGEHPDQPR
ncbi:hypothetical protein F8271_26595, partial [Micromonospora sp. ALFpr18c]